MDSSSHQQDMASQETLESQFKAPNFCDPQSIVIININPPDPTNDQIANLAHQISNLSGPSSPAENHELVNTPFFVYKEPLCQQSPFFNSAFNGRFRETVSQSMEFNDIGREAFGVLVNWVYTQNVLNRKNKVPDLCTLTNLWILGDRFLMPRLQNAAIAQIHNRLKNGTTNDQMKVFAKIACEFQDGETELEKLLVASLTWCSEAVFDNYADDLPEGLVRKMMKILKKQQRGSERIVRGASEFYREIR